MKRSKFTDSQIHSILKKRRMAPLFQSSAESMLLVQLLFINGAQKYGGMDTSIMSRLKELEAENSRLKKMYAEERLKAEILKEAIQKKW